MLSSYRARYFAARVLPRSTVTNAAAALAAVLTAAPQGLCGGTPPLAAARGVRIAQWAPGVPVHGGAASASGSRVLRARPGAATEASGGADGPRGLTDDERKEIDIAAAKMAWRAIHEHGWDRTLYWVGIDSWVKVRYLSAALQRRLHENGVPAAKTSTTLAEKYDNLIHICKPTDDFDLAYAQNQVSHYVEAYRKLRPRNPTFVEAFKRGAEGASFTRCFDFDNEEDREWGSRVLVVDKANAGDRFVDRAVKCGAAAINSPFVSKVQKKLSQKHLVVVTGESGAGKTFGAVMAAAQSARLPGGKDTHNAVVLYFSGFDVVRDGASSVARDSLEKQDRASSDANKEAYDDAVLEVVEDAVVNSLKRLDLPTGGTDSDGRRVVVVLDELGSERDVLRALCAMHSDTGAGRRNIKSVSAKVQEAFKCGPVYFVAVGTGCDTAVWQAGSSPASYSAIPATPASGREVFRGIIDAKAQAHEHRDIRAHIQRHAASICSLEGDHETAPTSHAWSAIGHALMGNARVAALVALGIIEALARKKYLNPSDQAATLEDEVRMVLLDAMRVFATLNGVKSLSKFERNHAVAQAAALMFSATDADLPEHLERDLCVRFGIVTSNAVRVSGKVPADHVALQGGGSVCVPKDKPRYSVSPAHLVMLLLSFGHTKRSATGVGFEQAIHDIIAVCVPAVIAARMWAESSDATLQKLAEPSSRAADLHSVAAASRGPAPVVHPFFQLLHAAAKAKSGTMQHWVRGSAFARLEPTRCIRGSNPGEKPIEPGVVFGKWFERLATSTDGTRQLRDAAVVLNGRGASGPDVVALFSPAKMRGSGELPAAVFVQCKNHQTPETKRRWKESVLAVLDELVKMGAPAFNIDQCEKVLGPHQEWRTTFGDDLRFAFDTAAAARGDAALGKAARDAYFVVVQCRAVSTTMNGHAKGHFYDLEVECAIHAILNVHATAKSPHAQSHARCFYIRTHPGDKRFAPVHIAKEEDGGILTDEQLLDRDSTTARTTSTALQAETGTATSDGEGDTNAPTGPLQ